MVEVADVVPQDASLVVIGQVSGVLGQHLLGPWPGRVRMGKVIGPQESLDVHEVTDLERHPVILERDVDVFVEVFTGLFGKIAVGHPVAMARVRVIHPVRIVGSPTRVGFRTDDLELRVTLEDSAEYKGPHHVLATSHDGEEAIDLGTPDRSRRARQDME